MLAYKRRLTTRNTATKDTMPRPTSVPKKFTVSKEDEPSKKRKWKPGTVAKRMIVKLQRTTEPLVNKAAIRKAVLQAAHDAGKHDIRFKKTAVEALREAASTFLVDYFSAANKVRMVERKNKTLQLHHTQVGRATMNVECVNDVSIPMILPVTKVLKDSPVGRANEQSSPQ